MARAPKAVAAGRTPEIEGAMASFSAISKSLVESYEALAERAERVEHELCRTNRELEEKVRELDHVRGKLEAVLDSLPTGVVVRDASGRVVRANGAALSILATSEAELVGCTEHAVLEAAAAAGGPMDATRRDGSRLVLAARRSRVRLADGSQDGWVEILDDRTETTALQERLHAADKMAALGSLVGGIAHEIRNPLNAVKGFAALLAGLPHTDERHARWAALVVAGASEADEIIESMLTLGRPERLRVEVLAASELLDEAVAAALSAEPDPARWEVRTHAAALVFRADRIKLRQALRNLIANALEAQPDGGRVEVSLERRGSDLALRVADAGPGIPRAFHGRVLDPFFTTRAEGTGLGLALVSTIAGLHGGHVEVSPGPSALGGAEISIRIPFRPAAAEPSDPSSSTR
jgi:signal transduction histidine kinase